MSEPVLQAQGLADTAGVAAVAEPRSAPRRSLLRHSTTFGLFSAGTYVLSLLKTLVVTHLFGTTAAMDAYGLAVLVPNLMGALVAGSAAAGLVPALALAESHSKEERAQTFRSLLWIASCVGAIVSLLLAVSANGVIHLVGIGLDPARRALAVPLLHIVSGMVFLNTIFAVASADLLSRRKYAITAAAPALSVVVSMLIILLFADRGISVLAYALLTGTALQAFVVLFATLKANPAVGRTRLWSPLIGHALRSQIPLLLASGIGVINVSVDQSVAGFLPAGAVSALSYGNTINGILVQCVIMSLTWVALPEFASLYAAGQLAALAERARECIRGIVLIAAPLAVLVLATGATAVRITFQHGAFNAQSTHLVYLVWAGYTLGLVPFAIGMVAVRMANAIHEQKLLAWIGLVMLPANAGLDYVLMRRWGVFGISLSTSLVYLISTTLLITILQRRIGATILDTRTIAHLRRTFAATVLSAFVFLPIFYFMRTSSVDMILAALVDIALVLLLYSRLKLLHFPPASVSVEI